MRKITNLPAQITISNLSNLMQTDEWEKSKILFDAKSLSHIDGSFLQWLVFYKKVKDISFINLSADLISKFNIYGYEPQINKE